LLGGRRSKNLGHFNRRNLETGLGAVQTAEGIGESRLVRNDCALVEDSPGDLKLRPRFAWP